MSKAPRTFTLDPESHGYDYLVLHFVIVAAEWISPDPSVGETSGWWEGTAVLDHGIYMDLARIPATVFQRHEGAKIVEKLEKAAFDGWANAHNPASAKASEQEDRKHDA